MEYQDLAICTYAKVGMWIPGMLQQPLVYI